MVVDTHKLNTNWTLDTGDRKHMARSMRASRLESRSARLKLPVSKKPAGDTVTLPVSEIKRLRKLGYLVDPDGATIPAAAGNGSAA